MMELKSEEMSLEYLLSLFLPNLIGIDLAKKLALIQMFCNPLEGERMHILYVGDPETGKGKIIREVARIHYKALYASSKRTTPVGIAEAVSMVDGGIVVCDELDKMDKAVRDTILEPMEDGTITVNKHGVHEMVYARVNILAACNPKGGRWEGSFDMSKIPLGRDNAPILSRFSPFVIPLKFLDIKYYDEKLVDAYYFEENISEIEREKIRKWFRNLISRRLEEVPRVEINREIMEYITLKFIKGLKRRYDRVVPIGHRAARSVISACKGLARIEGRNYVTMEDVKKIKEMVESIYRTWFVNY
mgnify:CR=1 FL=1